MLGVLRKPDLPPGGVENRCRNRLDTSQTEPLHVGLLPSTFILYDTTGIRIGDVLNIEEVITSILSGRINHHSANHVSGQVGAEAVHVRPVLTAARATRFARIMSAARRMSVGQVTRSVPGQTRVVGNGQVKFAIGRTDLVSTTVEGTLVTVVHHYSGIVELGPHAIQLAVALADAHLGTLHLPRAAATVSLIVLKVGDRTDVAGGKVRTPLEDTAVKSNRTACIGVSRPDAATPQDMQMLVSSHQSLQVGVRTVAGFTVDILSHIDHRSPGGAVVVRDLIPDVIIQLRILPIAMTRSGGRRR